MLYFAKLTQKGSMLYVEIGVFVGVLALTMECAMNGSMYFSTGCRRVGLLVKFTVPEIYQNIAL